MNTKLNSDTLFIQFCLIQRTKISFSLQWHFSCNSIFSACRLTVAPVQLIHIYQSRKQSVSLLLSSCSFFSPNLLVTHIYPVSYLSHQDILFQRLLQVKSGMVVHYACSTEAQGAHCEFRVSLSHKGQKDGSLGKGTYY